MDVHKKLDPAKASDADFEEFKGQVYAPDKMTEKALGFIDANKSGPFFLYMPYTLPHVSLQAPEKYIKQYVGKFDEPPYYGTQNYAPAKYPYSTYAAMITYLDAQVGVIMDRIKKLGLDNETIILFSSDNGATFNGGVNAAFFNSVDGLRGLKMDVFEGGIREPFIARWPGKIPAGKTSELISVQYDMMATFAELTGQKASNTDGISILPELTGNSKAQQQHKYLYFEYPEKGGQLAIRMGDWKGVKTNLRNKPDGGWMIFNLRTDRNETTDVAAAHPELVKQFDEIVLKEHQSAHIKEWEFINPKFDGKKMGQ
jgi:arylsulfatase A-like enzyme